MVNLCEDAKVVPVISRCYPLRKTAEALRYLGERHAQEKLAPQCLELKATICYK